MNMNRIILLSFLAFGIVLYTQGISVQAKAQVSHKAY
jgi:hypothetical protein